MGNLTQEQIDALLSGAASPAANDESVKTDGGEEIPNLSAPGLDEAWTSQSLTEENGQPVDENIQQIEQALAALDKSRDYLTPKEIDILGEMGNICMGAAATTMYTLLGRRVTITTPRVYVFSSEDVLSVYKIPFLVVTVEYKKGMDGKNLLILKENDSLLITDLLMGGNGDIDYDNSELDEIHMSAINEIMNQMIGASSTSLSNLLGRTIDITPPSSERYDMDTDVSEMLDGSELVIKVSFDMEIEGLLKSKLMQLMPIEAGKKLAQALLKGTEVQNSTSTQDNLSQITKAETNGALSAGETMKAPGIKATPSEDRLAGEAQTVKVNSFSFQSFDEEDTREAAPKASPVIDLISDIPLQVAVELGKTKKSINDIINMGIGSVIVLDKMAGELVEVVVNGKHIARGEVVVIDENYGVRITDIDHNFY